MDKQPIILIVDDDRQVRAMLTDIVREAGFRPVEASSAVKAIDTLESEAVDLVLLDIYMPGATGMDMLEALKRRRLSVPVIVVSGFVSDLMAHQLLDLGVRGILAKPFRPARVIAEMRSIFAPTEVAAG